MSGSLGPGEAEIQQDMDPQEATPLTLETQEAVSTDIGLQRAVMQGLGFEEGIPGVDEV